MRLCKRTNDLNVMSCRVQLCYHNVLLQYLICTGQANKKTYLYKAKLLELKKSRLNVSLSSSQGHTIGFVTNAINGNLL